MPQDSNLNTPLNAALIHALPTMVKDPFSDAPTLQIARLHKALGKSHETVYRWLRDNSLRRQKNVDAIMKLVTADSNAAALKRLGRKIPEKQSFMRFLTA